MLFVLGRESYSEHTRTVPRCSRSRIPHTFNRATVSRIRHRILSYLLANENIGDDGVRTKDGGLLMRFQYAIVDPKTSTSSDATAKASALLSEIEEELRVHAQKEGGIPTWLGAKRGTIWMVKGSPWLEVSETIIFL